MSIRQVGIAVFKQKICKLLKNGAFQTTPLISEEYKLMYCKIYIFKNSMITKNKYWKLAKGLKKNKKIGYSSFLQTQNDFIKFKMILINQFEETVNKRNLNCFEKYNSY